MPRADPRAAHRPDDHAERRRLERTFAIMLRSGWDECGLSAAQWADLALRFRADVARRIRAGKQQPLVQWGRQYLARHFRKEPSGMHLWLSEQFDRMNEVRGTKVNV